MRAAVASSRPALPAPTRSHSVRLWGSTPSPAAAGEGGLLPAGTARPQVTVAAWLEEVRGPLAEFRGAVFVKGSRRFQLESLFSASPVPAGAH